MNNNITKFENLNKKKNINLIEKESLTLDFNIKKYLDNIETQMKLGNTYHKSNKSNNINNFQTFRDTTYTLKNINTKYSSTDNILSNSINLKLNNNNKIISPNQKIKNKTLIKNNQNIKGSNSLFNNKNIFITISPNFNNISRTFKEFQIKDKSSSNITLNRFNRKMYKNFSTLNNREIFFLKKYRYALLDPIKILKKYQIIKRAKLNEDEKSINRFLNIKKEISKKNILLKLLNFESKNIINKETINTNTLSLKKKKLTLNKINFEEYKTDQKRECRKIEKYLFDIQKENRSLIEKEYNINYEMKLIKEKFHKILVKIDDCRIYGKFINEVFNADTTRFEKKIFPKKTDKELNFNYELLARDTIENYKCFLNQKDELTNDERFIKERNFILEPKKMIDKFNQIQDNSIRFLEYKKDLEEDIKTLKNENDKNIKYLKEKYEILRNEYISLKKNYQKTKIEYNSSMKVMNKDTLFFYYLIKDLLNCVKNIMIKKNKIIDKNNKNNINILDYLNNIYNIILEVQNYVDELILNLKNIEKEDKNIFDKTVYERKNEIKLYKQNLALQKIINRSNKARKQAEINKNKIIFIARKTEEPYHKVKKIKKKVLIDEYTIRKLENEELLYYDDIK